MCRYCLVAHCNMGSFATVGTGCLLHDVDVPNGGGLYKLNSG